MTTKSGDESQTEHSLTMKNSRFSRLIHELKRCK